MNPCPPDRVCELAPGTVYAVCGRCRTRRASRPCPDCRGLGVVPVGSEADVRAAVGLAEAVRAVVGGNAGCVR